jgi:hypothetical protein
MSNVKLDWSEDEEPTRPETPASKSGKYRVCFFCSEFIENFFIINEKCICYLCFSSIDDGKYSITKK